MSKYKDSNSLYQLVHAMTGPEKRYFTIEAQSHVIGIENHYLTLFDLIKEHIKQKDSWTEDAIKDEFKEKTGKLRFDLYKQNLYTKILESLVNYHKTRSLEIQLRAMTSQANILFIKGLGKQALNIISKAKKKALSYEKWYILLELLELDRHITYAIQMPQLDNDMELNVIKKVNQVGSLRSMQSQIWKTYMTHGLPTNEAILCIYEELAQSSILLQENKSESLEAKMIQLYCLQFLTGMQGKIEETYNKGHELIALMDSNPKYISDKGELYIRSLINLQYPMVRLGKYEELKQIGEKCLQKITGFSLSPSFVTSIIMSTFINQYDAAFKIGKTKDLSEIMSKLDDYYQVNTSNLSGPAQYLLYWQKAIHAFTQKDYDAVWTHIQEIENAPAAYRQDIQAYCKIMNLIVHFEKHNYRLLHHATLSTYRFLRKKGRLGQVEQLLLKLIKKGLLIEQDKKSKRVFFCGIYDEIQKLKQSEISHEAIALMYFENYVEEKCC